MSFQRKIWTMTSRAGFTGLITGLIATLAIYPLYAAWYEASQKSWLASITPHTWIGVTGLVILVLAGGFLSARWSGSTQFWRGAVLGGLAGGLAGSILFCFWGAAASNFIFTPPTHFSSGQQAQFEIIITIVDYTLKTFLTHFFGGIILGTAGGLIACSQRPIKADVFDKDDPQMAMNVAITAVAASIVAVTLAAAIFTRLSYFVGNGLDSSIQTESIAGLPLVVSLLILLVSHIALTLVVPHESIQAEHRCGMDEVKIAAYVGIAAAPVLILVLFLVDRRLFEHPEIIAFVFACTGLSLVSLYSLVKRVLPRKASFPIPPDDRQRIEASLFGSIARSQGPRLVML